VGPILQARIPDDLTGHAEEHGDMEAGLFFSKRSPSNKKIKQQDARGF
jgi:hypothetical protein